MRLSAAAALAVLLLAGCLSPTPEYARQQALAAPAATEAALGIDGAARAQLVTLDLRAEGLHIGVVADTEYHRGDAWTTTLRYTAFEGPGGNLTADAQGARILVACTPQLIVTQVSGGAGLGLQAADAEAPNPVGTCRPSTSQAPAFRNATHRALVANPELAAQLEGVAGSRSFPRMELKTAEWQRDGTVLATYDATDAGRTVPLDAVVRDARLQRTHAALSESFVSGEATVEYVYGARSEAPGLRGTPAA